MKKAVIFDMDGVIIDSELIYQKRRAEFFRKQGIELTAEMQQAFIGTNPDDMFLVVFPEDDARREQVKAEFLEFRGSYQVDVRAILNPEIKALLDWLKDRGYLLAVASSGAYDSVVNVLEQNQLRDYFDLVVSGQQFERSKPDPEIYRYTAQTLGVTVGDCLAIEDSEHGIAAAQGAEIEVLGLVNPKYQLDLSKATDIIDSLNQVPEWLMR